MAARKVRGILFDFDNTLVDTTAADELAAERARAKLLEHYTEGVAEKMTAEYARVVRERGIDPTGQLDPHSWRIGLWRNVLNSSCHETDGQAVKPEDMYDVWRNSRLATLKISDEVSSVLENLRQSYRIAIVTNSDPVIQKQKLAACQAERFFKVIVISGEQPRPKPHRSIFHTACTLIGVAPQDCVMVGDNLDHDIQGGKNAGLLGTVWVQKPGQKVSERDPQPTYMVDSVAELPRVLSDWN